MGKKFNSLESLLSLDIINTLLRAKDMEIGRLNTTITLLIQARVPFDIEFNPGNRRIAASAQLTIYINPTTTLNFTFQFQEGALRFGG